MIMIMSHDIRHDICDKKSSMIDYSNEIHHDSFIIIIIIIIVVVVVRNCCLQENN